MKLNRLPLIPTLLALVVLFMVAVFLATAPGDAAHAQSPVVDRDLPPLADISITSDPKRGSVATRVVTVKRNRVGQHPPTDIRNVKIRFTVETVSPGIRGQGLESVVRITDETAGYWSSEDRIWTIPNLPNDDVAKAEVTLKDIPAQTETEEGWMVLRVTAAIIAADPVDPPSFHSDNVVSFYYAAYASSSTSVASHANGDAALNIGISDETPDVGGETTFTVRADILTKALSDGSSSISIGQHRYHLLGVRAKIDLSEGLALAENPMPSGTTFNPSTGIWDIGMLESGDSNIRDIQIKVVLTSPSLTNLPLEKRCLTAEVISAVPWFGSDLQKRVNDRAIACLGKETEVELREDEIELFRHHDCVDTATYPCTSDATLELFVSRPGSDQVTIRLWERKVTRGLGLGLETVTPYLSPEQVTVHVPDHKTTRHDGKWRTGKTQHHNTAASETRGVEATLRYISSGFSGYTFAISDVVPKHRPGAFSIEVGNAGTFTLVNADSKTSDGPYTPSQSAAQNPFALFLSFGTLGTYKINVTVGATKSSTSYTASGIYTFHVGPMAELSVRDGGASPAVAAGQQAYTVMALNDGPDEAPNVRVTGLPTGVTEYVASEGDYDPASGVWTIGRLRAGNHRSYGHADEGPTLTLITEDPAGSKITAAIENTEDYCIRIRTGATDPANDLKCSGFLPTGYTEHTAAYYDHIERNNTATITARAGTGEAHPGVPSNLSVMSTPLREYLGVVACGETERPCGDPLRGRVCRG